MHAGLVPVSWLLLTCVWWSVQQGPAASEPEALPLRQCCHPSTALAPQAYRTQAAHQTPIYTRDGKLMQVLQCTYVTNAHVDTHKSTTRVRMVLSTLLLPNQQP